MFCKNCGTQIGDGLKFCTNCGQPIKADTTPVTPVTPFSQNQGNNQPAKSKKGLIIAIVAIVVIILAVVAFMKFNGGVSVNSSPEKVAKAFLKGYDDNDAKLVLKCVSEEARKELDEAAKKQGKTSEVVLNEGMKTAKAYFESEDISMSDIKIGEFKEVESSNSKEKHYKAELTYKGKEDEKGTIDVVKIDGKYYISNMY